jgi:phage baseplate assembly protein W
MPITGAPKLFSWRYMRYVVMKYLDNLIAWGDTHFRRGGREANSSSAAMPDDDAQIREMIGQILFPTPDERVNRPDFSAGLNEFLFAPITEKSVGEMKSVVQQALGQRLANVIKIDQVKIDSEESRLYVTIQYVICSSGKHVCDVYCQELL